MIANRYNRRQVQAAGYGDPSHHRWNRSRRAANHNIARRRALQPNRVHEHVEQAGAQRQNRRQRVHQRRQQRKRQHIQTHPERQGVARRHPVPGHRPRSGSPHLPVNIPVQMLVDRVGAPGCQGPSYPYPCQHHERRQPLLRQEHPTRRRDQQQRDDFRLGQRQVVSRHRPQRLPLPANRVDHHRRRFRYVGIGSNLRRILCHVSWPAPMRALPRPFWHSGTPPSPSRRLRPKPPSPRSNAEPASGLGNQARS